MPTIIFEGEVEMPDFNGDKMRKGLGEYFECLDPENRLTKFRARTRFGIPIYWNWEVEEHF